MKKLIIISCVLFLTLSVNAQITRDTTAKWGRLYSNDRFGLYVQAMVGVWMPTGQLSTIGVHPAMGMTGGLRGRRFFVGYSLYLSFSYPSHVISVLKDNVLYETQIVGQGYVGGYIDWQFFSRADHKMLLLSGIGMDGLNTRPENTGANDELDKDLTSLNVNVGFGYRFVLWKYRSVGLNVRYNFIHYDNAGGTDLSGSSISTMLVFGIGNS